MNQVQKNQAQNCFLKPPRGIDEMLSCEDLNADTKVICGDEEFPIALYILYSYFRKEKALSNNSNWSLDDIKRLIDKLCFYSSSKKQQFLDKKYEIKINNQEKEFTLASFYLHMKLNGRILWGSISFDVPFKGNSLGYLIEYLGNSNADISDAAMEAIKWLMQIGIDANKKYWINENEKYSPFKILIKNLEKRPEHLYLYRKVVTLFIENGLDLDKKLHINGAEVSTEQAINDFFELDIDEINEIKNSDLPEIEERQYETIINRNNCKTFDDFIDCLERNNIKLTTTVYISNGNDDVTYFISYALDACLNGKWTVDDMGKLINYIINKRAGHLRDHNILGQYCEIVGEKVREQKGKLIDKDINFQLLQKIASYNLLDSRNKDALLAFILFALRGLPEPLELFLNGGGVNLDIEENGVSLLSLIIKVAAKSADQIDNVNVLKTLNFLIDSGADINYKNPLYKVIKYKKKIENDENVVRNLTEIANLFIEKGADLTCTIEGKTMLNLLAEEFFLGAQETVLNNANIPKIIIDENKCQNIEALLMISSFNRDLNHNIFISKDGGKEYLPITLYVMDAYMSSKWPVNSISTFFKKLDEAEIEKCHIISNYCHVVQAQINKENIDLSNPLVVQLWGELMPFANYDINDINHNENLLKEIIELALQGNILPLQFIESNIKSYINDKEKCVSQALLYVIEALKTSLNVNVDNVEKTIKAILDPKIHVNYNYFLNEFVEFDNGDKNILRKAAELIIKAGIEYELEKPGAFTEVMNAFGWNKEELLQMAHHVVVKMDDNSLTIEQVLNYLENSNISIDSRVILNIGYYRTPLLVKAMEECINGKCTVEGLKKIWDQIFSKDREEIYTLYERWNTIITSYFYTMYVRGKEVEKGLNDLGILELILSYSGIDLNQPMIYKKRAYYPIHLALKRAVYGGEEYDDLLIELINKGANLNARTKGGTSSLGLILGEEDVGLENVQRIIEFLIEKGVDVNEKFVLEREIDSNISISPLMSVFRGRHKNNPLPLVKLLVENGANVNEEFKHNNKSYDILILALSCDVPGVIDLLKEGGLNLYKIYCFEGEEFSTEELIEKVNTKRKENIYYDLDRIECASQEPLVNKQNPNLSRSTQAQVLYNILGWPVPDPLDIILQNQGQNQQGGSNPNVRVNLNPPLGNGNILNNIILPQNQLMLNQPGVQPNVGVGQNNPPLGNQPDNQPPVQQNTVTDPDYSDLLRALVITVEAAIIPIAWYMLSQQLNIPAKLNDLISNVIFVKGINMAIPCLISGIVTFGIILGWDKALDDEINIQRALANSGFILLSTAVIEVSKTALIESLQEGFSTHVKVAAWIVNMIFAFLIVNFLVPAIENATQERT